MYESWQFKQFVLMRMLNLMLLVDSFDSTRALNSKPKTVKEIDSKFYPYYDNHKGNILF